MKKKVLLLILAIFLILVLTGCGTHFLDGMDDEGIVEQIVWDYWRAITNRQYELAKWYCVPDGVWYNKTDEWEEYINTNSEGEASVIVSFYHFYEPTEVIGNNAMVYALIFVDKIPFPSSCIINVDTFEYEIELIKETSPPGGWKLK